jgi:hypothetical protein
VVELIESDPILGDVVANYPSDRIRLAMIGGGLYAAIAFVVNFAFLPVDAQTASIVVIAVMALTALIVGWWLLHLWYREVILYQRGFSYNEGSRTVFINFDEITSIRQRAERRVYFGGLVRRTIREVTIKTIHDETIVLNNVYKRLDDFLTRLEVAVNPFLKSKLDRQLFEGRDAVFSDRLVLKPNGVEVDNKFLAWTEFTGFQIKEGQLAIDGLAPLPLVSLDNLKLLLDILNAKKKRL